jgi:predicted PurR-regulated permease PerM
MSSDGNKIHKLEAVHTEKNANDSDAEQPVASSVAANTTSRDMSKVAVIVSLLVVVLLVIFFFGMNRNIAGLTEEVKSLGVLRQDVTKLDERMLQMEEGLPSQMKRMLAHDMVNEMAMKAAYLGNTLEDQALRDKMQGIMQSLKEVRGELEK